MQHPGSVTLTVPLNTHTDRKIEESEKYNSIICHPYRVTIKNDSVFLSWVSIVYYTVSVRGMSGRNTI